MFVFGRLRGVLKGGNFETFAAEASQKTPKIGATKNFETLFTWSQIYVFSIIFEQWTYCQIKANQISIAIYQTLSLSHILYDITKHHVFVISLQ